MGAVTILILAVACAILVWEIQLERKEIKHLDIWARMEKSHAEKLFSKVEALEAENDLLRRDKERLTQGGARAQDTPRRVSGAELRRIAERKNATVPTATQAERLENHG